MKPVQVNEVSSSEDLDYEVAFETWSSEGSSPALLEDQNKVCSTNRIEVVPEVMMGDWPYGPEQGVLPWNLWVELSEDERSEKADGLTDDWTW